MKPNDGTGLAGLAGRRKAWPVNALLAVGGWLVVSPLVLSTTRVTAGLISAVTGGLALVVLAGGALVAARRRKSRSASAAREHRQQVEAPDGRR